MMRPAVQAFRMANMVNASGLADLRHGWREGEHARECHGKKSHWGRLAQYIGFGLRAYGPGTLVAWNANVTSRLLSSGRSSMRRRVHCFRHRPVFEGLVRP